jgi:uncharacterized protein YpuA (DUF1002 family)
MIETVSILNERIEVINNEIMEIKSQIAKTDSTIDLSRLCEEMQHMITILNENYKKVTELERTEMAKRKVINFWLSKWDYIGLFDAIKEANQYGFNSLLNIRQLKEAYKTVEEYQL